MTNHEYGVSAFDDEAISEATIRARKELHTIVNGLKKIEGPWKDLALGVYYRKTSTTMIFLWQS